MRDWSSKLEKIVMHTIGYFISRCLGELLRGVTKDREGTVRCLRE